MAGRGVWSKAFHNFLASLRSRQIKGNLMGEDHFHTKYYEIPAGTSVPVVISTFSFSKMFSYSS